MRREKSPAILPEPRPDAFAISVGDFKSVKSAARKKLKAALAQARANYQQSVATYRTAVLTALQDTEDQLSEIRSNLDVISFEDGP